MNSLKRDEIQHIQNFTTTSTTSLIACPKLLDQQVAIKLGTGFKKVQCMFYSGIVYIQDGVCPAETQRISCFCLFPLLCSVPLIPLKIFYERKILSLLPYSFYTPAVYPRPGRSQAIKYQGAHPGRIEVSCHFVLQYTEPLKIHFFPGLLMKIMPIALQGIPHLSYLINLLNLIE